MAVRPEIALAVQRPKLYDPGQVLSLRDLAQQGEMRRLQMEDLEASRADREALKQVYGQAGALDTATGLPTAETLPKIGAIKPELVPQIAQQRLTLDKLTAETERARAGTRASNLESEIRKQNLINEMVRGPALAAYDQAAKTMPPEQATRVAQQAYSEGMERAGRSGLFSVEERGQFELNFDPMRVRQRLMQSKDWMSAQASGVPRRQDRIQGETLIQEERDPVTGAVKEVGRGPRFSSKPLVDVNIKEGDKAFEKENKLRDDFKADPNVKAASEMNNAFKLIEAAYQRPSAANDLAMATKYMKILDPTSVVRESEFALAVAATGLMDKVQNYAASVLEGKKLNPQQRKDFYESAKAINTSFQSGVKEIEDQYSEITKGYGLKPENVIPSLRRRSDDKKKRIKFSDLP